MMVRWLRSLFRDREVERVNAMFAQMDRAAMEFGKTCPICNGTDVFLCPDCLQPIKSHTHENDYMCDCWTKEDAECATDSSVALGSLRDVNPIRQSDGKRVVGDGRPRPCVMTFEDTPA